ncbi:hypothetical protein JCM8547_002770 [Rhodosporidiobolus lusitaniae]
MSTCRVAYVHSRELLSVADDLPANEGRASLIHELLSSSGLLQDGQGDDNTGLGQGARARVVKPREVTRDELCRFHDPCYIDAILGREEDALSSSSDESGSSSRSASSEPSFSLSRTTRAGSPSRKRTKTLSSHSLGLKDDCPTFPSLPSYARLVAGASMTAARLLRDGEADVAISWTGGRHHGKRGEASGFCYVNDIVLAIMELRTAPKPSPSSTPSTPSSPSTCDAPPKPPPSKPKRLSRILYVDLDLHHGDGVEYAFFTTPSCLTLSLHLHAPLFFPSTGALSSAGPSNPKAPGALHALNVALEPGLGGESLERVWESCVEKVKKEYEPDAVVLQCGVDGLSGDPCKEWNIPLLAFGSCVSRALAWNLPTLLLGGGGYNHPNAARAWTYLTSIALNRPLPLSTSLPASLSPATFSALSASSGLELDVPASFGVRDRNTDETLRRVEEAFARYAEGLRERYAKKKEKGKAGAAKQGGDV